TKLIEANTTIPTKKAETFTTAADNQPSVEIHVLQGERPMAKDNKTIGRFHLDGIPPAPRGVPQVEVSFDIDANGIIHVTAKDKATNKEQSIRIESSSGLTEEEIKRMRDEAKANEEADKQMREKVDKLNAADSLIFSTEKQLKEFGDKLSADKKATIEKALEELKEVHKKEDLEQIDAKTEALNNAWKEASEEMYKATQEQQQNAQQGQPGDEQQQTSSDDKKDDGEVTDVDFEEVK
ncbi:MAG TPA: Hsp70 family protein, partial [Bacteroidales bacterium]|nr:Hsp70 family protein [Bacteroidales bacterium]